MKENLKNKLATILSGNFEVADSFVFNTVLAVEELSNYDMIYIYHHLKTGSKVVLEREGTNVKGDLRYKVSYQNFVLGYVTITGVLKSIYADSKFIESEIVGIEKQKFLPISGLDIVLQATKMRMVS